MATAVRLSYVYKKKKTLNYSSAIDIKPVFAREKAALVRKAIVLCSDLDYTLMPKFDSQPIIGQ